MFFKKLQGKDTAPKVDLCHLYCVERFPLHDSLKLQSCKSIMNLPIQSSFVGLILLALCLDATSGFASLHKLTTPSTTSFTRLQATEQLVFSGDYCGFTKSLPPGTSKNAAEEFMLQDTVRDLFFSAGGTRPIQQIKLTPELLHLWTECCEYFGYDRIPTKDDLMVQVESSVQFPGMKLTTCSASGMFLMENESTGLKEYHTFFVAEEQRVSGLPPAVWLYNKLTGNDKKAKGTFHKASGKAISVISIQEQSENALAFCFDIRLQIFVQFPRTLMKLLPMSKEKMEEQSGTSMRKAISKDVDLALESAYNLFLSQSQHSVHSA